MRLTITILSLILLLINACEEPASLEAVSGVAGTIEFGTNWPDSLTGAAVVVFDLDLAIDSLYVPGYPVIDHFVTYGDPISRGTESAEFFIQLKPGGYMLMVIGMLLDPAALVTNDSLLQEIQNHIVVPENSAPRGVLIREKQVNEQTDWYVQF